MIEPTTPPRRGVLPSAVPDRHRAGDPRAAPGGAALEPAQAVLVGGLDRGRRHPGTGEWQFSAVGVAGWVVGARFILL